MSFSKISGFIIFIFFFGQLESHSAAINNKITFENEFQQSNKKRTDTVSVKKLTLSELVRKSTSDGVYLDKIEDRLLDSAAMAKIFTRVNASDEMVKEFLKDPRNKKLN